MHCDVSPRVAQESNSDDFHIHPHLVSKEREIRFLSRLSEVLIICTFPTTFKVIKHLDKFLGNGRKHLYLSELFPITRFCDPFCVVSLCQ